MKKLSLTLLSALALGGVSFAGHEVVTSSKDYKPVAPDLCFNDQELQLDVFGAYIDGNSTSHAGPIRDHAWGGGIGINYFFHRNIGIGVDATWVYARENANLADHEARGEHTTIHNFSGSVIFRAPIDSACLAPYGFLGGGFHVDGEQWASAHAGVGIEFRVVPQKVGIFADARWTYFGDRFDDGDQNNFMGRAGVRVVF